MRKRKWVGTPGWVAIALLGVAFGVGLSAGRAADGAAAAAAPAWWAYLWLVASIACQVGMVLAYRAAAKPHFHRHSVLVGAYGISSVVSLGLGFADHGAHYPLVFAQSIGTLPMTLGLIGGCLLVFSAELYLRSTATGPMSITWTIRQNETMPATVVSFFLHPKTEYSPRRLVGVLLLIPTLAMFGWDKRVQERRKAAAALADAEADAEADADAVVDGSAARPVGEIAASAARHAAPWMFLAIASMLLLGTYRLNTLWIGPEVKTQFMLYQYMTCVIIALCIVFLHRHRMHWPELRGGIILGLLSSFNLYFTLTSMAAIGAVLTFAGLAVGVPTVVTLMGAKFYGEKLHWRSAVGLVLALIALLLTMKWQGFH